MRPVLLLMILSLPAWGVSQTFTLEDALGRALQNRPELKAARLSQAASRVSDSQWKAEWMPQVNGTFDWRWSPLLPTSVIPVGSFGFPGVPADAKQEVRLGAPFATTFAVQAEQRILQPGSRTDKELNGLRTELESLNLVQREWAIKQAVVQAFYGVLLEEKALTYAGATQARAQARYAQAEARNREGSNLSNDLERLSLELRMTEQTLSKAKENLGIARMRLAYECMDSTILRLPLGNSFQEMKTLNAAMEPKPLPSVEIEEVRAKISESQASQQTARRLPTISAYGTYGVQQLSESPNPLAADTWFANGNIGVRASIPIFTGNQPKWAAQQLLLASETNLANAEALQAQREFQIQEAISQRKVAEISLNESEENLALAKKLYETDQVRFTQGVLTTVDLTNSEFNLRTAEQNSLQSLHQYLLADLRLRFLTGHL